MRFNLHNGKRQIFLLLRTVPRVRAVKFYVLCVVTMCLGITLEVQLHLRLVQRITVVPAVKSYVACVPRTNFHFQRSDCLVVFVFAIRVCFGGALHLRRWDDAYLSFSCIIYLMGQPTVSHFTTHQITFQIFISHPTHDVS